MTHQAMAVTVIGHQVKIAQLMALISVHEEEDKNAMEIAYKSMLVFNTELFRFVATGETRRMGSAFDLIKAAQSNISNIASILEKYKSLSTTPPDEV